MGFRLFCGTLEVSAREVVQSVAIGVAGDEGKIVEVPRGERNLEGVVIGDARIGHLIHVLKIGKFRIEGAIGSRFAVATGDFRRRIRIELIQVLAISGKRLAAISNIV